MKCYFLQSSSDNPWFNLGIEEYFFRNMPSDSVVFYLWQNKNTVVIGRTQNAWKECRVAELEADGGRLARRSSGGGAVFHDLGNLCYTFLGKGGTYDQTKQLQTILDAVKTMGIDAAFTGRNDITADGRKFSGNAFKFERDTGLMHGTLMVDTDESKLSRYLSVSPVKLSSKGINSVRSRVVNLKELAPDITIDALKAALCDSFRKNYGNFTELGTYGLDESTDALDISMLTDAAYDEGFTDAAEINRYYAKYSSWDFRLGENPSFDLSSEKRFAWGCVEVNLSSSKGVITACRIFTDANNPDFAECLSEALTGSEFGFESMKDIIYGCCPAEVADDLCGMVKEMC